MKLLRRYDVNMQETDNSQGARQVSQGRRCPGRKQQTENERRMSSKARLGQRARSLAARHFAGLMRASWLRAGRLFIPMGGLAGPVFSLPRPQHAGRGGVTGGRVVSHVRRVASLRRRKPDATQRQQSAGRGYYPVDTVPASKTPQRWCLARRRLRADGGRRKDASESTFRIARPAPCSGRANSPLARPGRVVDARGPGSAAAGNGGPVRPAHEARSAFRGRSRAHHLSLSALPAPLARTAAAHPRRRAAGAITRGEGRW